MIPARKIPFPFILFPLLLRVSFFHPSREGNSLMISAIRRLVSQVRFFLYCGVTLTASISPTLVTPAAAQDVSAPSIPVQLSDFELFSSATSPSPDPTAAEAAKKIPPKDAPPAVFELSDIPSIQARRLMDFFALTLLQSFQKAGYNATRQQANAVSSSGILLRGVFAEADGRNRIRRAILGGGAPGAKLLLYVGTFNLARPDQPLYQPAVMQNSDARYGPIITLNNYIPLVKFEMSKNPTEDEVRKICTQIVQNLTTLLQTNPAAFAP
jgi:hypothetical protein